MAEIVQIPNAASTAKIRNPLAVLGLGLITLGIYHIFWWYFINREMADYGRGNGVDLGDNPVMSVVAITLGALIIVPPFVSVFRTLRRVERAQNHALGSNNIAVILLFILIFIPLVNLVVFPIMQSNLNQVWEAKPLGHGVEPTPADAGV
jgi:Na+-driven multidrug efflux pump